MLSPSEIQRIHQENRAAWNEAASRYASEIERDVAFLKAGGTTFHRVEQPFLAQLGDWCTRAIHLQCAGGTDTLSLWNHGAAEVVGLDISERMIATAREKAAALGARAQWFCCDVLQAPHELDGTADLVYTGKGALPWIMEPLRWAEVVSRLLKPGGRLYLFEGHPLTWVWQIDAAEYKLDPDPRYGDYFSAAITDSQGWPTSYIPETAVPPAEQQARKFERQWTLGEVINALVAAGLRLRRLEEYGEPYWDQFPNMSQELIRRMPQTYSLLMSKD